MHAFTKFKFAKRVFLLLSGKIGISYKVKKGAHSEHLDSEALRFFHPGLPVCVYL